MIVEHAQAVLDLLEAVTGPPALNVHDGVVPADVDVEAEPYVLVYFDSAQPDLTFTGEAYTFQLGITCHSVGGSALAARMVAERVREALLDVTPTVAGRTCYPIRWDSGAPPRRDETTGALVMDQVDVYVLRSVPA